MDISEQHRARERIAQGERNYWEMRRECYVALNRAARQYLSALTDMVHSMLRDADSAEVSEVLDAARAAHRDRYAEAQMVVPDAVLEIAGTVNRKLNQTYGLIKRLDNDDPSQGESIQVAHAQLNDHWDRLRLMRQQMRIDLGVSREVSSD
ncbi:hypothetical protein [Streptomyces sp. NBC_00658]|uniref:hypothetical protein n=1 Tax=Streptomyces sp. NBC_00658 TaxID=2975800 RepID=UPI003253C036